VAATVEDTLDNLISRVARASDRRSMERLLRRRPEQHARRTVERLSDEVARRVDVDLNQAARLADAAAWIAERLRDEYCRARATRARAHVLFSRGKYQDAVDQYAAALAAFRAQGNEVEAARTLSSSIQSLAYLGRYGEAQEAAEVARDAFDRAGDRVRVARLDTNLGSLHYRLDRFAEALKHYERAHREFLEYGQPHDVAVALRNIAVCHISLNQFPEALASYREARQHCAQHGLSLLVVKCDYNIAYLYYLRGEYTQAIELYRGARQRSTELGDAYHGALCDLDQSELYLELNLIDEGMHLATQAFGGFEKLEMRYEAAKALTNLAIGAGRLGQAFRALELFVKAREMFVREGNEVWPALIDAYRALVLHEERRYFEARRYGEAALAFFDGAGLPSKAALCELVLVRVHLQLGELVTARKLCLRALDRLARAGEPSLTYRAYFLLGQVEEALGDRPQALNAYQSAQERLETLRSHLEQDELKIGFLKDKLAVYESLVWMTLGGAGAQREEALLHIEQAKSRSLSDLLTFRAQSLPSRAHVHSKVGEQVQDLRQELNWYYRKIDLAELRPDQHSPQEIERLRRRSRERERQLMRMLLEARSRDDEFASLQSPAIPGLSVIRSTLPAGTTILEYYQARGTILVAVISRESLEIVPLTPASRVRHLLRLLQFQLSKFRLGDEYVRTFAVTLEEAVRTHLRQLHAELVAPVLDLVEGDHLVVVPHEFLHYLPFHALFDGTQFLSDRFAISYAPSASVHHLCRIKRPRGQESLVLGVPDAATPHIAEEARTVAAALPDARLFVGGGASVESLRTHGPHSRFVHIATHGLFRYDNPMFSSLQLAGSRLSLSDLYQLELGAELVTLSGCGTGLNVVEGGDELLGLVRGLLYAGAQSALVTLWDVNDRSTSEFMRHFYGRLPAAPSKAVALGEAMRALRDKYPHPYYWAPYILVGSAGPAQ
jgi:CHAT domain-containing protein